MDSAGTSTFTDSKLEVRVGDVEVSTVASVTSTTSANAPVGLEQSASAFPTISQFMPTPGVVPLSPIT